MARQGNRRTCIFVIGYNDDSKSSIIRSLTGCGQSKIWYVKDRKNKRDIKALVILTSIGESFKYPEETKHKPTNFPDFLEKYAKVKKIDKDYKLLICPMLADRRKWAKRGIQIIEDYLKEANRNGFKVKVGIIERSYINPRRALKQQQRLRGIKNICKKLRIDCKRLDNTHDYHTESARLRQFYP